MSTLTSASTDAQVFASYDDNASYEEDGSRTKALAFRTACMILLRRRPSLATRGEQQLQFETIGKALTDVNGWLESNPATSGETGHRTRYFACENFQGY